MNTRNMPSGRKRSSSQMSKRRSRIKKRRTVPKRRRRSSFLKTFPKSMPVTLTYCDDINVPNRDGGAAPYTFRLNSIFDPDYTSTGHQPRGYDQYASIFSKYCVVGAEVTVEPLYTTNAGSTEVALMGFIDDDLLEPGYSIKDLVELGLLGGTYKHMIVGPGTNDRGVGTSRKRTLKFKFGTKKFFGVSKGTQIINPVGIGQGESTELVGIQNVGAEFGTNPDMPAYLKLHCSGPNHDGADPILKCRVTIKFSCVVHSPIEVGRS